MARRSELSGDERVEEIKRLARERQRSKRSRDGHVTTNESHVTEGPRNGAHHVTPSQTLPFGEKTLIGGEVEGVGAILAAFAPRGYKHNPRFLAKMLALYPALDLELEAIKLAEWLEDDANRKAKCTSGRIHNWLEISEQRRLAGPRPSNGTTNGHYVQPISQQGRNPGPDDLPRLEADMERVPPAPRREGTLKEKLAGITGGKR